MGKREEPERIFSAVLVGMARPDAIASAPTIAAPPVAACGEVVALSERTVAAWRALGVALARSWFAYSVAHRGPDLVLRAVGDIDCDGRVEVHEATITTTDSGELMRTVSRMTER